MLYPLINLIGRNNFSFCDSDNIGSSIRIFCHIDAKLSLILEEIQLLPIVHPLYGRNFLLHTVENIISHRPAVHNYIAVAGSSQVIGKYVNMFSIRAF